MIPTVGILSDYEPHDSAAAFHEDESGKDRVIVAPIRSGKTFAVLHEILVVAWNNPTDFPVLVMAPTNQQLRDINIRPLYELLLYYGVTNDKLYNKSENIITLKNGKRIYGRSAESFERIRGLTIYESFIDEAALCSKEAIDVVKGRMLTTKGRLNLITTPKGKNNWVYTDYFQQYYDVGLDPYNRDDLDTNFYKFNIFDNPAITEEAFEKLLKQYDSLNAKQELYGEFVNLYESLVYREFDRGIHLVDNTPADPENIWIGVDWNVGIHAAIVMTRVGDTIYCIDEFYNNQDVVELGQRIVRKYGTEPVIVTDAMNAQSNRILLRQCGLHKIVETKSNPKRVDRYNAVNIHLKNAAGDVSMYINKSCTNLIADLEMLVYKSGTDVPDTGGEKYGHISDAMGYCLLQMSPNYAHKQKKMTYTENLFHEIKRERLHNFGR